MLSSKENDTLDTCELMTCPSTKKGLEANGVNHGCRLVVELALISLKNQVGKL